MFLTPSTGSTQSLEKMEQEREQLLQKARLLEMKMVHTRSEQIKNEQPDGPSTEEEQIGCISDLYHQNASQPQKSNIMLNNVAEIHLIPNVKEVRKGDLNITITSNTLYVSRKFKTENSQIIRSLYLLLLHLLFDTFEMMTQEDNVLPMIHNIVQFLPTTCSCKSEGCQLLKQLPSPITKTSQLHKCFVKSDELKSEFLKNVVKGLDWIFRKSKTLNESSIKILQEALQILQSTKPAAIEMCIRHYIQKWISFSFSEEQKIEDEGIQNKFLRCFMAILINTPFTETDKLEGRPLPLRSYLRYGSILKSAFEYIGKTHKVRTNKLNCKCCVCTSSFSPENLEMIFLENVFSNVLVIQRKENFQKVKNLLDSMILNSSVFYQKNSIKLNEILQKIDYLGMETKEQPGKRKYEIMDSSLKSSKYSKVNDYKDRTEKKRIVAAKNKRERRRANNKQKVAGIDDSDSITKKKEVENKLTASAHEVEATTKREEFRMSDRLYDTRAPQTNILSKFDFDDLPELFLEYQ